jgi:hypothetical protein
MSLFGVLRLFDMQCSLLHPIKLVGASFRAVYQSADILTEGHVVPLRRLPSGVVLMGKHEAVQWRLLADQLGWTVFLQVITLTSVSGNL